MATETREERSERFETYRSTMSADELALRVVDCESALVGSDQRLQEHRRALDAANALIGEAADEAKRLQDRIDELVAERVELVRRSYKPETIAAYARIIEVGFGIGDEAKMVPSSSMLVALRHLATMVHCDLTGELREPHTHLEVPAPEEEAPP